MLRILPLLLATLTLCASANAEVVIPRYTGEILPTPRQVVYQDKFLTVARNGKPVASVLMNADPTPGERSALAEIELRLGAKLPAAGFSDPVVISIGRTPYAEASLANRPAGVSYEGFAKEGYVVRFEKESGREHVVLWGPSDRGTLYAAASFCQLIRKTGDLLEARRADITDWPAFLIRSTPMMHLHSADPADARDEIDFRSRIKANTGAFHLGNPLASTEPVKPPNGMSYGVETNRMGFLEMINPYSFKSEGQVNILDENHVSRLIDSFDSGLKAGTRGIMLCLDDTCREITYEELIRFRDTGYAHAYLYRRLYDALKPRYPDAVFLFLPVPYGGIPGDQQNKDYMNILGAMLPSDVGIVWSGPGGQANRVDSGEIDLYSSYVGGRKPFYWDNSAMWVHKLPPGLQFLDAYRAKLAPEMAYRLFARGTHLLTPCDEVFLMTWADCLWNPEAYDPDKSWRRALAMLAGQENVEKLIEYNQLWIKVQQGLSYGECVVDDLSEYDAAIGRMEEIAASVSQALPKSLGTRLANEPRAARQKLTDWTAHLTAFRRDCAVAEQRFLETGAPAVSALKWRHTQGSGWTARPSSIGLSGEHLGRESLLIDRDPVAFSSRTAT